MKVGGFLITYTGESRCERVISSCPTVVGVAVDNAGELFHRWVVSVPVTRRLVGVVAWSARCGVRPSFRCWSCPGLPGYVICDSIHGVEHVLRGSMIALSGFLDVSDVMPGGEQR